MHPPEIVEVAAGRVTIVTVGAMIVDNRRVCSRPQGWVDRLVAGDDIGMGLIRPDKALIGAGIFLVPLMDNEVDGQVGINNVDRPVGAKVINAIRSFGGGPFGGLAGINCFAPEMQPPAIILAIGALVVDRHKTLRRRLRRVEFAVILLEPDFGAVRAGIELAVGLGAILGVATVDDKVDIFTAVGQLDPGESAIVIFTQERLGIRPISHFARINRVAPKVEPPEVVEVAGRVVTIVAITAHVVDNRIGEVTTAATALVNHGFDPGHFGILQVTVEVVNHGDKFEGIACRKATGQIF